jgi:polysaccharide export outer membrane protein
MKNRLMICGLILLVLGATKLRAQDATGKDRPASEPPATQDKAASLPLPDKQLKAATDDPNYIIGPEDELSINVWREPDISSSVPVRPDGRISLPLLNDVQASGLTPMQLGFEIATRLKKFISDPKVTIIVTKVNSQRIYIVGEVTRAGAFPLVPNMTVLEAISSAGGCTIFAKQSKIYILRLENGKEVRLPFNYKEVLGGQKMSQNILLKPGDTIVVP